MYRPKKEPQKKVLLYIITAGGTKNDAEKFLKIWSDFARSSNYYLAIPIEWDQDLLLKVLNEVVKENTIEKVVISGMSNGGYNSCNFGLGRPDLVDAIIPMGASCSDFDVDNPELSKNMPVLIVVGENDTWARGEDKIEVLNSNKRLNSLGVFPEVIVVPNIGHVFPFSSLPDVKIG